MKNYDDLIPEAPAEQPAPRGGNKYDEIVSTPDTPDVRATAVSLSALSRNPELSAKARTLGQRYGLPVGVIERNLPELEKRAQQDTNNAVLQRSPLLSRFIGADPDRAAVAIDDLPTFGEIERNLGAPFPRRRTLTGTFRDASAEARREADRFGRALQGARRGGQVAETPVDYSIVDRVRYGYGQARAGLPIAMNELTGLYDGDQFGLALAISDRLRDAERANLATPPAAVAEGARAVGEAEGFLESGVAVLGSPAFVLDTVFTSLGQSAPSMLAGLAGSAAGPAGQAIGAGAGSLAVEYSASLIDSIREAGLTPTNAQEVYRALTDPALMDQAREKALKRGMAIATFDALTAGLAGNILRNARGASRTAMAAAVAGEAGLQAAGGAGGELVAQLLTESSVKWGEVFLEGIAEIATGAVEVPSNLRAAREAAEARFARNDHNAMLAEYHANQVKQLSELAGASKVLARDPRTLQEFIDSVAVEGGRVEDIYVDARQFAQAVGEEKLAELRQASPSVAAQIDEAIAIGGDLVVPLGEFATTIGQSDVMPSVLELIRPDAAEMSLAEAKQFAQARDEQMLAEAERALEEAGEASEFTRSAMSVEQRLLEELQSANRFTEPVNARYAKLVSAFFTTMAKRAGVLPEQFAERYKLRVRNEAVQGGRQLDSRPVTETPEFKTWFGDSKVVDENGAPLVVYHGTNADFSAFDPSAQGSSGQGSGEPGFFFEASPDNAGRYTRQGGGGNVMPVYLSLKNPLIVERTNAKYDYDGSYNRVAFANFIDDALEAGHDGVIFRDVLDRGKRSTQYVAFYPEQIKSAIGNRGTFDPTVASILAQPVTAPTGVENFKPGNLHTLLGREDWTILTAHNPMGQQLSPEENAARNERLREELDRRGLDYIDSIGKYVNDILADPPEDGFAVFGVTPEIANEIGNMFEQDSVLTGRGLLYHDMTLNPADGTITEHATPPENYFTSIPQTGALFTMGINFEQRIPFVRQFAQPADRGRVDNVAVVHYSQQPRTSLVSWFYGTGMKGAEYERVMSASDTRLRQRIHFYVSAGQPIVPESGVGRAAHVTTVSNLYDADLDHLKLRRQSRGDANAFESAILDAGYDGYLSRTVFGRQGTVVMLGRRDLRVEQVSDPDTRLAIPPAPLFTEGEILAREIAAHRALPTGSGKLDWWQGYLPKVVPDLAAKIPDGAWDRMRAAFGDADIYRSDLARLFDAPEIGRSFAQTVSTRVPRAVKAVENPFEQMLVVGLESSMADPKGFETNIALMAGYEGFRFTRSDKTAAKKAERMIQHMVDNLLWLHDQTPDEVRQRAQLWYDGARRITDLFSERFGRTDVQVAAVLAVLSPQKDWFMNVTLAERVLDIYTNRQDFRWSPEMTQVADDILGNVDPDDRLAIEGRTLRELDGQTYLQALWLRTYDQAHNPRTFRGVDPGGDFADLAVNYDGETNTRAAWGSFGSIGKAIEVLRDGSVQNVSRMLGNEHKVRNFYNNIFNPAGPHGDVTIDTHAVAAALLQPLAGSGPEVLHNFGGTGSASSSVYGTSGTYGIYAEAYRRAAAQRGILPREMQSITWEAVRGLFRPEFKRATSKLSKKDNPILSAWADYRRGKDTADGVRSRILEIAGGIANPPWFGPRGAASQQPWASSYADVLRDGGGAPGAAGPRDGGVPGQAGAGVGRAFNQAAYHGTPHRFDRFSLAHLGTGEGVQAFGWGLYFTSERDIAEWYRRKLSEDQAVVNWRIGNRYIVRDEQIQDYSPRPASGDIGQAWSVAVEGLMLAESELRDTLYAGGDVRAKAAEILDEIIEIEKSGDYRQGFVFHLERIRDQARDGMVFDLTEPQGQLYQVNIPEESEMLAWDKPLSEQPEKVRDVLPELVDDLSDLPVEYTKKVLGRDEKTGQDLYNAIAALGTEEFASKYLSSWGIKGISYQADGGRTDARNFVVFDDTAIEVLNTFYQQQQALRGQITFGEDITRTPSVISLFEQANLSTFLHESGHFFLEVMADVAARGESAQVADDMNKILRWFGVPDLETWRAMSPDQQRPHHERFARGFERYLMEGQAPSRSLEGLFASFRAWLLSVYRALIGSAGGADAALNVSVSDEVRQVMDRLIATDEEIAEAQDSRRYAPLFKSAEEMGATPAEWAAYQREHGDALEAAQAELGARSLREMRWLSGAKSRELKRLQAEAKAARAAVEEEARAEVRAEPVYAAMRWLKHGEMVGPDGEQIKALSGFKLDIDAVRVILAAAGLDTSVLGAGKYGMAGKDGLAPQVVAEMFGFPNGETLVHSLVNATPEADAVEALTDQRMLERYGELVDDKAMDRAADAAVHNEARGRFVAVELRALTRALNKQARTPAGGSVNALARAARELADRIVLRKPIKDIKPAKFSAAEVRAAKAAEKALAGNDLTTAVTEKRNQMVNFYAARAAHNALGRFEVGLRKMKRALESDGIDQEYRDQIAAILDRYNLRPMTKKEQQRAKSLVAWVAAQKAAGYEPVIDEDVLNEARRVPVRDLTVEEFDGLVASVENIAHLGRLKKKLLTAKDAREFAARVDEAEAAIRDNATRTIPEQIEKGRLARFRSGVKEFFVMHRKFANTIFEMDGWRDGGVLWELFVRPMNEAADREAVMREQATIRLAELFKAVSKDASKKVFIKEINTALTAEARIMVALNTGNAGNLQRLMDGDRWSIDQVKAITDTLTKEQWDFVQGVWDVIDEYRPMIAEQQKRITGVEPKWVEAIPVATPYGLYRGGYFPAKYDTDRSTRSLSDEAAAGIMDQWRATRGAARTRDSFTKERAAKVIMRPLRKDFGVVTQHITEVTHRLAWQEYLIDATRLLNASPIDAAVREHYGPEVLRSMRDTIADVAAGEIGAQNAFEKAINHLRVGTTIVGLGWNLTTGLLQPIGLTQSMVRIGPKWVAKGLAQWLGDAVRMESSVAAVYEKSEFMRLRGKTMQREISEIRNTVSGTDSRITASYFYFIQKLQIVADMPTWLGMYTKAVETMNVDEATAVALADQAVLDAQSGGQVKDLAAIQRGGPMLKLFTNFYSFFNTTFNLTRTAYGRTNFRRPGEAGLFIADMLLLYTAPAVLGTLLKAALQGDTDDEDELIRKLIADQMNYLLGTMVGLREIGGATAAALGLPSGYSGPAGVRFFSEVQKLAKQVEQGEADAAFFKALNSSAGILFHYPAGQLNRTAEGVNAYLNGETENPAALVVGPPR